MDFPTSAEQYNRENLELKAQIEKRTGKTTEQLYAEREKLVRDAIDLKEPERIPFSVNIDAPAYCGVSNSAAYYDPLSWKAAMRCITLDLEPDIANAGLPTSGSAMELLDVKNKLWPGGNLPPSYEYQFVEGEFMQEDEYDMFISDPTGFMLRRYLPRVYGAMTPLAKLPTLDSIYLGFEGLSSLFASPEFVEMATRVAEAGRKTAEYRQVVGDSYEELAQLGFPGLGSPNAVGVGGAPFDTLSSFLRGMKGSMVDMYRRPAKLLQACELILERRIAVAEPADPKQRGNPKRIGIPLWRGDKAFMSDAQFKRFYWPGLKKALQADIDLGFVPMPFFEAEFGDRLECLLELPKGKVLASVEYMDAAKARAILKGHACVMVRCPPLSSRVWSLSEVESYVKDVIDKYGRGGGFILNVRIPDKGTPAEKQAMVKAIRDYARR